LANDIDIIIIFLDQGKPLVAQK